MKEITQKIDKYSEKFLNLLQGILMEELKFIRMNTNFKFENAAQLSNLKNGQIYCENKHRLILNKLDMNQDDSCLSDLEDEILKTCQSGANLYNLPNLTQDKKEIRKSPEIIFEIKKETKQIPLQENNSTGIPNQNLNFEINTNNVKIYIEENKNDNLNYNQDDIQMKSELENENEVVQIHYKNVDIQIFAEYVKNAQDNKIYQPLKHIHHTSGNDTWHESRKSSENFMDAEPDLFEVEFMESKLNLSPSYSVNYPNSITTQTQTTILNKNNYNEMNLPRDSFKIPKSNKINPKLETCSNLNFYNKPFIPKVEARDKLKNRVPFLRDFKPKFLKKENIDKKILRKFRNYVKVIYKMESEQLDQQDKIFWKDFTLTNLLPPMKYRDEQMKIEFRSFSTKFLLWLFSKEGCVKLYQDFSLKFGEQILQDFITAYDLINNNEEEGIIDKLKYYINAIPEIYSKRISGNWNFTENFTNSNFYSQSEEVLASYLGSESIGVYNNLNNFNMTCNNFTETSYPRCGKKIIDRPYYEDFYMEECESVYNFKDSVMNNSFDSIASN